jgi:hypothetical protein
MTGRIWLGEHAKGNEYNKHNKEKGKWLGEILNMTGWKIVFLFLISTSLHEIGVGGGADGTGFHNFV